MFKRLWQKFMLALLIVAFMPIGYFMYQSLNQEEKKMTGEAERMLLMNTVIRSRDISSTFVNAHSDIDYLRYSVPVKRLMGNNNKQSTPRQSQWRSVVEEEFRLYLTLKSAYSGIGLLDEYGDEVIVMSKHGNSVTNLEQKELRNRVTSPYFEAGATIDGSGIAAITMRSGLDPALDLKSETLIRYATKIFDDDGKAHGVIYLDLNGSDIFEYLGRTSLDQKRPAAFLTKEGNYIFNPFHKAEKSFETKTPTQNISSSFSKEVTSQALSGMMGIVTDDPKNIFAFTPIYPEVGNLNSYYVVFDYYERSNFNPMLTAIKKNYLYGFIGAFVLSLLSALGLSYMLTRNLDKLRNGVDSLRKHRLDYRIDIKSGDELESLASAYNSMAESLQEYSQSMEQKVLERSQHIKKVEKELMQAEKLAAIGVMGAGVAHEINNPISIIVTRLELIKKDIEKGKVDMVMKDLEVLHNHAERIGSIAMNLLTFSRASSGEKTVADLNEIVERVASLMDISISKKGIKFVCQLSPSLPSVLINISSMEQALYNIIYNAFQATEPDGEIRLETKYNNKGKVILSVEDTGHGIEPDVMEHLFEPFFTTKKVGHGTGLGLSITYGIIEEIGGSIEVESKLGKGSIFTITLEGLPKAKVIGKTNMAGHNYG